MNLTLQRLAESADGPTFGEITNDADGSIVVPATLELPDKNNEPMVSRIPAGVYVFTKRDSPHIGYEVWETNDVPNRTGIALHKLNWMRQTDGCIGVGESVGELDGEAAILQSTEAFDNLMQYTQGLDSLTLTVLDVTT